MRVHVASWGCGGRVTAAGAQVRLFSTVLLSLATGSAFYGAGRRFDTRQGITALAGSAYTSAVTLGIFNACAVRTRRVCRDLNL